MARGTCTFRQRDVTRAIRGAQAAGVTLRRVWIEADGRIVLGLAYGQAEEDGVLLTAEKQDNNEWDEVLDETA